MFMLAEISDKMPTIVDLWVLMGSISMLFAIVAILHRWLAFLLFPLALMLSIFLAWEAYQITFYEDAFSEAIWHELGGGWVANAMLVSLLPTLTVLIVIGARKKACDLVMVT